MQDLERGNKNSKPTNSQAKNLLDISDSYKRSSDLLQQDENQDTWIDKSQRINQLVDELYRTKKENQIMNETYEESIELKNDKLKTQQINES